MSNRTIEQSSLLAELKVRHEAQIDALTRPGLSERERVEVFAVKIFWESMARSFPEHVARTLEEHRRVMGKVSAPDLAADGSYSI